MKMGKFGECGIYDQLTTILRESVNALDEYIFSIHCFPHGSL